MRAVLFSDFRLLILAASVTVEPPAIDLLSVSLMDSTSLSMAACAFSWMKSALASSLACWYVLVIGFTSSSYLA